MNKNFNINTSSINVKGSNISISGNVITVDGKKIDIKTLEDYPNIKIFVEGNVEYLQTEDANIEINGDCQSVISKNGNINVKGNIKGNAETKNGNVISM